MKRAFAVLILCSFAALGLSACVGSTPSGPQGDQQLWKGPISGMVSGEVEMTIRKSAGASKVLGRLNVKMSKAHGEHTGTISGTVNGKVINGEFSATFNGMATVEEGRGQVRGRFKGSFSENTASGTWIIESNEIAAKYTGEWRMTRQ
ncbi:MAG: hypothetical protein D3926_23045 [Desulfobacteraceae bacterium]|nr:MAG: hypothetical protein D3926_23045 [Desulfobacteraceae bacterium]